MTPSNKLQPLSPREKELQGVTVKFKMKTYEFSHILDGQEYFVRIEWKKGVKHYINQYCKRPTK